MGFLELAQKRYSCRSFENKMVEQEKIDKILEAGRLSPTGRNLQPQRILVLTDKEKLNKLSECTKYGWNAPVIMIICYDRNVSWKRKQDGREGGDIDASIVTTHMMFEIAELELGTTWIGSFDPVKVRGVYNIPENYEIVSILPIGYPSKEAKPSELHFEREDLQKIVFYNNFEK